jgi:hypothetical protein
MNNKIMIDSVYDDFNINSTNNLFSEDIAEVVHHYLKLGKKLAELGHSYKHNKCTLKYMSDGEYLYSKTLIQTEMKATELIIVYMGAIR